MGKIKKSGFIPTRIPDKGLILARLKSEGQKPMSQAELEVEFKITRASSRDFRHTLKNMVATGQLRKVRGNQFVAEDLESPIAKKRERIEHEETEAKKVISEIPLPWEPTAASARKSNSKDRGNDKSGKADSYGRDRGRESKFGKKDRNFGKPKRFGDTGADEKLIKGKLIKQGGFHFVQPMQGSRGPSRDKQSWASNVEGMILVPKRDLGRARPGDIVSVRIVEEDGDERYGKIIATLSQDIAFEDVSRSFAKEFHIPFGYPKEAMEEAGAFPEPVIEAFAGRRDLRDTYVITIDPSTAKDHDDAISLEKKSNGNWLLGVHIADVAEYVTEDSALDEEAVKRAFTQYLPWTAAPMLPQRLSSDLCSLLENRERLAFSCMMEVNTSGEVKKFDFVETFIRVDHFYSYEEAQAAKEAGDPFLILMDEFAGQLMARRRVDGFIDFQFPEPKVELENGIPLRIFPSKRLASHSWIEECMLLANRATARFLMKHKLPGLFRVHEQPDIDAVSELWASQGQLQKDKGMIEAFKDLGETGGFLNPAIQQFFIRLLSQEGGALPVAVQRKILQSMKKAQYSSTAHGHFALGWLDYAHFTSPIRRYADLWTHRIIKAFVHGTKLPQSTKVIAEDIARQISEREIAVMKVERKGMKVATSWVLRNYIGEEFVGEISGLENFGIFVSILEPYGEGLIPVRRLRDDFYEKDDNTGQLVGKRTRNTFSLGDKIRVRLERSDPFSAQVDFEYLGPPA